MRKVIIEKLQQIEKQENVRILHLEAVHGVLNLRTVILMYALFMCVRVIII